MFKKILLPSLVISGAIFASYTIFLAGNGSKSVDIKLGEDRVIYAPLRDVLSPAVGALFTLGLGVTTALVLGWEQSVRESSKLEKQVSNLRQMILEKESQIEEFKISSSNPQLSELSWFLDAEDSSIAETSFNNTIYDKSSSLAVLPTSEAEIIPVQPSWIEMPATVTEPVVIQSPAIIKPETTNPNNSNKVQTAASAFASTQYILGLTHKQNN